MHANNLPNMDWGVTENEKTDSFVEASLHDPVTHQILAGTTPVRTLTIDDELEPVWDELLTFPVMAKSTDMLKLVIFDEDASANDTIGTVYEPIGTYGRHVGASVGFEVELSDDALEAMDTGGKTTLLTWDENKSQGSETTPKRAGPPKTELTVALMTSFFNDSRVVSGMTIP